MTNVRQLTAALVTAGAVLLPFAANAASVTVTITGAAHTFYGIGSSQTGGVVGAFGGPTGAYGDGVTAGISPTNVCTSGTSTCPTNYSVATNAGGAPQNNYSVGSPYWLTNPTPNATYSGTITYDDVTGQVTAGAINWTGTYGAEFLVNSAAAQGSFYSIEFSNGSINLGTGARTGSFRCDVGGAGYAIVGTSAGAGGPYSPLCAFQNQASYGYAGTAGTPAQNVRNFTFTPTGPGAGTLSLQGNRYTLAATGNNLQETFAVQVVPVPAAVWLFGSALGLMGIARRKLAA